VPLALLPVVMKYFGRVIHYKAERIQDHFGTLSSMVQENLSGVRIVRAYGQEEAQEAEFDELNREYMERNMALARHPPCSIRCSASSPASACWPCSGSAGSR
jgi:ATP-binding cassette, subfamily B, multidrug efflux pump